MSRVNICAGGRLLARVLVAGLVLAILNFGLAIGLLWGNVNHLTRLLERGQNPLPAGQYDLRLEQEQTSERVKTHGIAQLATDATSFRARLQVDRFVLACGGGEQTYVMNPESGIGYAGPGHPFSESRAALAEAVRPLKDITWTQRVLGTAWVRPWVTGLWRQDGRWGWRIRLRHGAVRFAWRRGIETLHLTAPFRGQTWRLSVQFEPLAPGALEPHPGIASAQPVPAEEIDRSMAEVLRIAQLAWLPVERAPDGIWREGAGWLRVQDGHRLLSLEGTAYEMGYQHGRLLAPQIRQLMPRLLYGVGLYYSLTSGRWFPAQAAALVEHQRPWIEPAYFEEMRGVAEGAGIPLAAVLAGNIFPEFFHCSGAALFGEATRGGQLLHARVLDYMTGVGLQDAAVVIALRRTGAIPWVNVGFAGFIGSVTGMNARQIAIGEMGGAGEGDWDGTPMSFLVRGALETAVTLEEAVAYMRDRPRTCEYFYVISDGKQPDAVGVAATPTQFEVVRSGQATERLPEAIPDVVALSQGGRYRHLVRRIRAHYGQIDADRLGEIIKRPVAMKSNLHNAIFAPRDLTLWVTVATRHGLACDQSPVVYTWPELFP